ncbi:WD40-repeat-containing domain protein [Cercophora newfieldiana]|uniref:WD40-repeat-containing domain protein n=1 Tax=Cercophora newfieldiana TaxID=92897 RepID=A0AA39XTE3_9PEZI|nr:WD40-repeat-containing domain protein [Cercophora newfieldiana]
MLPEKEQPTRQRTNPQTLRNTLAPATNQRLSTLKIWDASKDHAEKAKSASKWFSCNRPYLSNQERGLTVTGAGRFLERDNSIPTGPVVIHVDFTYDEIDHIRKIVRQALLDAGAKPLDQYKDVARDLRRLWRKSKEHRESLLGRLEHSVPRRSRKDLVNFLRDLIQHRTPQEPAFLTIATDQSGQQRNFAREARVQSLLFRREISGYRGYRSMRRLVNFNNEFKISREDDIELRAEWTDCAGDIITIAWASNDAFICGTTEHSDSHNQQYNKPGNLVLGSCKTGIVQSYPEHRVVRPIVEKGENSTAAMRQTQDPWLYSSVVASDYDAINNLAFTSGFDRTVKIWEVTSGSSMRMTGEWIHDGNVNFAAASKDGAGMVATGADVAAEAVRIYHLDPDNISASSYRSFSCSRITDAQGNTVSTEKWAYFPATMQWGLAPGVQHLLLVGYSPRSLTGDDSDIPEDKLHTGELCLWDGRTGERWRVIRATTPNVFEVMWHPTQVCFIAATSPQGLDVDAGIRTQITVFTPPPNMDDYFGENVFVPIQTLDCTAADINELTIMPNSAVHSYVTAGCTDGNTYVWDTARGDRPIHILRHGESVEELQGNREREDVGVKFTAWGSTPDRFYTGSSDGVVKVWNVRSLGNPLVQNLLEAPAPITCGMFSPDRTRLLIGDASGRIFLLSIDDQDIQKPTYQTFSLPGGGSKTIRLPTPIVRHPEPAPPPFDAEGRPIEVERGPSGSSFLRHSQLRLHPNPTIGAVQGPRYMETGLFCKEAHLNEDPQEPLLAAWEGQQQSSKRLWAGPALRPQRPMTAYGALGARHRQNLELDVDIERLSLETRLELEAEGAELEPVEEYGFVYEEMVMSDEFEV